MNGRKNQTGYLFCSKYILMSYSQLALAKAFVTWSVIDWNVEYPCIVRHVSHVHRTRNLQYLVYTTYAGIIGKPAYFAVCSFKYYVYAVCPKKFIDILHEFLKIYGKLNLKTYFSTVISCRHFVLIVFSVWAICILISPSYKTLHLNLRPTSTYVEIAFHWELFIGLQISVQIISSIWICVKEERDKSFMGKIWWDL